MLARLLQITSLLLIAAAAALAFVLTRVGVPLAIALLAGALLPIAFHGVPLAIEFAFGAVTDRRPGVRLGLPRSVRVWAGETRRAFVSFTIDQPWRAAFAEPRVQRDPARPAVLFVHGYFCNRAVWLPWLRRSSICERWNIATVNLEPPLGAIDDYVDGLATAIGSLRGASGADHVTIVAHSMGGLAVRAYLRARTGTGVARVITLDTPHQGTVFARFGQGVNSQQMRRGCDYLRELYSGDSRVELICFASRDDNLIVPRGAQVLGSTEAVWFEGIGHLAMTANDEVLKKLIEVVERPR